MLNVDLQPLKLDSIILMFPVHLEQRPEQVRSYSESGGLDLTVWGHQVSPHLESGAGALHQQQLQVFAGLQVFTGLQGLVDPVRQFPSTCSELHKAPPPSQQPQLLQVT